MASKRVRLSRQWAREQSDRALHGIAGKLRNLAQVQDLSKGQEWLWRICVEELEYRSDHALPSQRCSCDLCVGPFDYLDAAWVDEPLPELEPHAWFHPYRR